jgi:chromosome segregation ATPase
MQDHIARLTSNFRKAQEYYRSTHLYIANYRGVMQVTVDQIKKATDEHVIHLRQMHSDLQEIKMKLKFEKKEIEMKLEYEKERVNERLAAARLESNGLRNNLATETRKSQGLEQRCNQYVQKLEFVLQEYLALRQRPSMGEILLESNTEFQVERVTTTSGTPITVQASPLDMSATNNLPEERTRRLASWILDRQAPWAPV